MSMDPRDFFKTADHLKAQGDEHFLRTSISRSYYAVHLYIRHFISKTFLEGKDFNNSPHMKVIQCMQSCKASDIQKIGVRLNDLCTARKIADYEMSKKITHTNCQDAYDDANELLKEFAAMINIPDNSQKFSQSAIQQDSAL